MANYDQDIYDGAIAGGATPALAELMVAQARHESQNYTNHQTQVNNNVFGFKYSPNSQYATEGNISPEGNAYAHYDTLQNAILDYIQRWMGKSSNDGGTRLDEFNQIPQGDTTTYAIKLKSYGYYSNVNGESDQSAINRYIGGLNAALLRIDISAAVDYVENKAGQVIEQIKKSPAIAIGIGLILVTGIVVFLKRKSIFK